MIQSLTSIERNFTLSRFKLYVITKKKY
nr:unnamed protein product [Callosobruchus analis]